MGEMTIGMLVRILRQFLATIKAIKGCKYCPEKHPACLDFHHRDPTSKTFSVSQLASYCSWRQIEQELEKCDVVCANCHRRLHYDEKAAAYTTGRIGNPILLVPPSRQPKAPGPTISDRMAQVLASNGPQSVRTIATTLRMKPNIIRAVLHKNRALFGRHEADRSLVCLKQQG